MAIGYTGESRENNIFSPNKYGKWFGFAYDTFFVNKLVEYCIAYIITGPCHRYEYIIRK